MLSRSTLAGAILAGVCTARPVSAQPAVAPASCPVVTRGADVEAVRILEQRGAAVNVSGWTIEEARSFFAPEWVSLQPDGSTTKLDTVLSGFKNGRSVAWARSFVLDELDIRVFCDTAVVIGIARARPLGAPEARVIHLRYVNLWRRRDGRWVYTANQFVRF